MGTRVNDAARKAAEEAAKKAAEEAKANANDDASNNASNDANANDDARIVDLSEYHGKEADDITRLLLDRPDFENHDSLMITNIIDNSSRYAGALTIVVNRNLPQFVKDAASGTYVESTTRNIFTTRIQLNAILKGQGEPMLANAVMTAPLSVLLVLFKKARISVLGHVLAQGEIFVNPYASRMAREERVNEHDRYEYFPYELSMRTLSLQDEIFIGEVLAKYQPDAEGAA
ncbi:hypothetical protein [uncultured phage cr36_1]|uniref:Uncharacterized protein n=1 Tax=uncultured phage cr36_1 TaxID=2986397 RepID=A0AAE7V2A4_9CAUD|nr:hypothetical protein M1M47_gp36 [uncultured phage cr36_1]QWM89514.1 hypothetical protein [uncultured phage cr36_1]